MKIAGHRSRDPSGEYAGSLDSQHARGRAGRKIEPPGRHIDDPRPGALRREREELVTLAREINRTLRVTPDGESTAHLRERLGQTAARIVEIDARLGRRALVSLASAIGRELSMTTDDSTSTKRLSNDLARIANRITELDVSLAQSEATPASAPAAVSAGPAAAMDSGHPAASARHRPSGRLSLPSRFSIGLPGLKFGSRSFGPSPARTGGVERSSAPPAGPTMSATRDATTTARSRRALAGLHAVDKDAAALPDGASSVPETQGAMTNERDFRHAVMAIAGSHAGGAELSRRVLEAVPALEGDATPYLAPLMLATALHTVSRSTPSRMLELLADAERGERSPDVFRLQRVLASTTAGTQALGRLLREPGADRLARRRDQLNLCADLERKGFTLSRHSSASSVLRELQSRVDVRMNEPIGTEIDAPLQLLGKALRHSRDPNSAPGDQAAFVAWKRGGFTESGAGTAFNDTIGRLHKFMAYVDRADHGPRTPGALARDVLMQFRRTFGIGKSPLAPTRHGALGGDLGLRHEEATRLQASRDRALRAAVSALTDELRDPMVRTDPKERDRRLPQAAVLDLWRETGATRFTHDEIAQRCTRILRDVGDATTTVDLAALARSLRRFTHRARSDDGKPAVRVGVAALATAGAKGAAPSPRPLTVDFEGLGRRLHALRALPARSPLQQAEMRRLQAERRQLVDELTAHMRSVERGASAGQPVFKWSDLRKMLRGVPQQGPSAEDARRVLQDLANAPHYSLSTFTDGRASGLSTVGALPVAAGALGLPLVYPVMSLEASKRAVVSVGLNSTSARLFIGTETGKAGALGVGGGWAAPTLADGRVQALAVADAALTHDRGRTQGAVVLARRDHEGWHEALPPVIDFLFDQAQLRPGQGRAPDAGELWERYAVAFGHDERLSVGWADDTSSSTGVNVGVTALARGVIGNRTSIGPGLSVGGRAVTSRFERSVHAPGNEVPAAVLGSQVGASATATATQLPPLVPGGGPVPGWAIGVPLAGASLQWEIGGGLGVATLGRTREGQLSPAVCTREVVFRDAAQMAGYINRHRSEWERSIVSEGGGAVTRAQARERLDGHLREVAGENGGTRLHGEIRTLAPEAARRIDAYEDRVKTLQGQGDALAQRRTLSSAAAAEIDALRSEVHRLLQDDQSWLPAVIYTVEENDVSGSTGLSFGVVASNRQTAKTTHLTQLFTPASNAPPPPPEPSTRSKAAAHAPATHQTQA